MDTQQSYAQQLTASDIKQRARQFNATHSTQIYGKRSYYKVTGSQFTTICIKHVVPTSADAWQEQVVERYRNGYQVGTSEMGEVTI